MPAEAEAVRHCDLDVGVASLVRHVVEIARRILHLVVDRRRQLRVTDREDREHRLDRAGRSEAVAGCSLRARNRSLVGVLLTEGVLEHLCLGGVADRRGGRVCVDVVDLVRGDARVAQRHLEGVHRPGRIGLGDVLRVGRKAVPGDLGIDLGAARLRMLVLLEHDDGAGLAHHETVALGVERPRCPLGVVIAQRQRTHRRETGYPDLVHGGLGAAAEHHIRTSEPDRVEAVADRHVRGGARCALRTQGTTRAELDRDPTGTEVRNDRRNRERIDAVRAPREESVVALLERAEAADARRYRRTDAVCLRRDIDPGIRLRLPSRGKDQVCEAIHPPRVLAVDPLVRVEVLDLTGEMHLVIGVVELRDLGGARVPCKQARPRGLGIEPKWRHRAQPGDDDASASVERTVACAHYIPSPPSTRSTSPVMNDASSEQRKRTAPATSLGSPSRPSGVLVSIAAVASSGRTSVSCVRT